MREFVDDPDDRLGLAHLLRRGIGHSRLAAAKLGLLGPGASAHGHSAEEKGGENPER